MILLLLQNGQNADVLSDNCFLSLCLYEHTNPAPYLKQKKQVL